MCSDFTKKCLDDDILCCNLKVPVNKQLKNGLTDVKQSPIFQVHDLFLGSDVFTNSSEGIVWQKFDAV